MTNEARILDFAAGQRRREQRNGTEAWRTKKQIAEHLGYSTRWVELRVKDGMPSEMWGNQRRFRASDVEAWLRDHYAKDDR